MNFRSSTSNVNTGATAVDEMNQTTNDMEEIEFDAPTSSAVEFTKSSSQKVTAIKTIIYL